MSVIITNLDGEVTGINTYELTLGPNVCLKFKHNRSFGLASLLRKAAYEIDMLPCSLGVGCDETGVCHASAYGRPDQCGKNLTS